MLFSYYFLLEEDLNFYKVLFFLYINFVLLLCTTFILSNVPVYFFDLIISFRLLLVSKILTLEIATNIVRTTSIFDQQRFKMYEQALDENENL